MTTSRLNFTEPKHTKAAGGLLPLANFSTNLPGLAPFGGLPSAEIGRGAGWGRGENSGGARSFKKKKKSLTDRHRVLQKHHPLSISHGTASRVPRPSQHYHSHLNVHVLPALPQKCIHIQYGLTSL